MLNGEVADINWATLGLSVPTGVGGSIPVLLGKFFHQKTVPLTDKIDIKTTLGEYVQSDNERFGLSWPGKRECKVDFSMRETTEFISF